MIEGTWSEARRIESWPPPSLARAVESAATGEPSPSFAARRPIYDRALDVHAYELLFRPADADVVSAGTVVTSFADIGLDALVGGRAGFVKVTRDFVMHGLVTTLPAEGYPYSEQGLRDWFCREHGREPTERELGALMSEMATRDDKAGPGEPRPESNGWRVEPVGKPTPDAD